MAFGADRIQDRRLTAAMDHPYPGELERDLRSCGRIYFTTHQANDWTVPNDDRSALAWLPTLICVALGGTPDKAQVAQSAWALHYDASDVIDQIQDSHIDPSLTPARALSAGIALIFSATEHLGRLPEAWQAEAYTFLNEMLGGQTEDVIKERPTAEEALDIAEKKAGAFMAMGCVLGARCAGAAPDVVAALEQYGRALGTMVQIHDDLELIEGLGKVHPQPPERYTNVALAFAWQVLQPAQRDALAEQLTHYWTTGDASAARQAYTTLVKSGARLQCAVEAAKRWDRARKAIDAVRFVSAPEHRMLLALVDGIANAYKAET